MPAAASPRPAPSSASRSGTTSAPGSSSPATQPSPTSRNSSLSVAQQPNPPGLLPLLRKNRSRNRECDQRIRQVPVRSAWDPYFSPPIQGGATQPPGSAPPSCHGGQQIVLGNDAIAVPHQIKQHVEHLWFERDPRAALSQLAPVCIEAVFTKDEFHRASSQVSIARRISQELSCASQRQINRSSKSWGERRGTIPDRLTTGVIDRAG